MDKKVCSIVVTFNRKELLIKNIEAIIKQKFHSHILIIDNASTDGTFELLEETFDFKKHDIEYANTGKNIGGAGGFCFGLEKAYDMPEYDYYWLMDDDGWPRDEYALQYLMEACPAFNDIDILNSLVTDYDGDKLSFGLGKYSSKAQIKETYVIGLNNPFNGTLVPRDLVTKIGFPRKEFFLGYDETEYMARCKKYGGNTITVVSSQYYHPTHKYNTKVFLGKTFTVPNFGWRYYYRLRNQVNFRKHYMGNLDAIGCGIKSVIRTFVLGTPGRLKNTSLIFHAYLDGYRDDFSIVDLHITNDYDISRKNSQRVLRES